MNGRIDKGSFEVQGPTPTPTPSATPCASAGAWAEQSPYPIVTSGHAVASQGGNVYSFGGIANNVAIANAYKYTPATNTWTPLPPFQRLEVGSAAQATALTSTCLAAWTKTSIRRPRFGATTRSVTPITPPAVLYHPYLLPRLCLSQRQDLPHRRPRHRHRFSRRGLRYCHKYMVDGCELPGCES